jgi:hypothetical protein
MADRFLGIDEQTFTQTHSIFTGSGIDITGGIATARPGHGTGLHPDTFFYLIVVACGSRVDAIFDIGRANIVIAEAAGTGCLSSYHRGRATREEMTGCAPSPIPDNNHGTCRLDAAVHPMPGKA